MGLLDRSGYVFDPEGLSRGRLLRLAAGEGRGARCSAALGGDRAAAAATALADIAEPRGLAPGAGGRDRRGDGRPAASRRSATASTSCSPTRSRWRARPRATRGFSTRPGAKGRRIRYEATVGAGLPILDTYRKLVESGDRVLRIEGCVSGTLGFVLSAVSAGRPFSDAVREAVERGYAEPDPRDDLSGRDAARKGLILARLLGYRGAIRRRAEDLVPPPAARACRSARSWRSLPSLDDAWRRARGAGRARGRVLRYVVTRHAIRGARRGSLAVPARAPTGSLAGTRNLISFTTRRYRAEPLVVTGPGAGAEVTAAGILNDIQQLAAR